VKILLIVIGLLSFLSASELHWNSDYKKALQEAKIQNKDIYMLITASDCRWCRKFEDVTLSRAEVIEHLKEKYVLLSIDRDFDDVDRRFNLKSIPRHYFIDKNDKIIHTFLGAWKKDDFYSFLKDVVVKKLKIEENR